MRLGIGVLAIVSGVAGATHALAQLDGPRAAMDGCAQAVVAAIRRDQPYAEKVWAESDPRVARTALGETTVRGKGRLVLYNGEWQTLRFLCTYQKATGASYIVGVLFDDMMPATARIGE